MPSARVTLDDYRAVAPRGTIDVLLRIGERLRGRRVVQVTASRYTGPFVEALNCLVPTMNDLGIDTEWEIIVGDAEFDATAHAVGRALSGTEQVITDQMLERFLATGAANASRLPLAADLVVIHDVPPLLLADRRPAAGCWVWRSYGDLSAPQTQVWSFLRRFIPRYEAVVASLPKFAPSVPMPRFLIHPTIDPLSQRNRDLSRIEQAERLARLRIPRDKPFLLQIGPLTRANDPLGAINVHRLVKKHHDVRLVLAGPGGDQDPAVLDEISASVGQDQDIISVALEPDSEADLNALERAATVVLQKPLRTDFGLDVAMAMWKGKPVIGSTAGGIPFQIVSGVTGYTVETVEGAAFRIRYLLSNPELIGRMGAAGREHVRRHFLITRQIGDSLALLAHLVK
jgi:trehalose synthase